MPNMDYPGPCLSCIDHACGLWDDNRDEKRDENRKEKIDREKK